MHTLYECNGGLRTLPIYLINGADLLLLLFLLNVLLLWCIYACFHLIANCGGCLFNIGIEFVYSNCGEILFYVCDIAGVCNFIAPITIGSVVQKFRFHSNKSYLIA